MCMKKKIRLHFIIAAALVIVFCGIYKVCEMRAFSTTNCDYSYVDNPTGIEKKKEAMLSVSDNENRFWFSDDTDLQESNPRAYWLMNRMMQMVQSIVDAEDDWAWMLAMNESIEIYNENRGCAPEHIDAALADIERLIGIYGAGSQAEINTASYVDMMVMHYRTVYAYYNLIEQINDVDKDKRLSALYYQEFKEWFDLNNAQNGLMCFYTYAAARYSAMPMELNGTFARWSEERLTELEIERQICLHRDWKPFKSDSESVLNQEFDVILNYFKGKTPNNVVEEMLADWVEKDYEFAREQVDGCFDFEEIAKMIGYYETAIANWRTIREEITLKLPKEKLESYREITKQMHTRLYRDLLELKEIQY